MEIKKLPKKSFVTIENTEEEYLVGVMKKHSTLTKLLWNTAQVVKFCYARKGVISKYVLPNAQDLREAMRGWTRNTMEKNFHLREN